MENKQITVVLPNMEEERYETVQLYASCIKEVFSLLTLQKGETYIPELLATPHFFVLAHSKDLIEPLPLTPETLLINFGDYDQLIIVPDISGNPQIGVVVWAYAMMAFTYIGISASVAAFMAEAVVMLGSMVLSMGMSMLVNLLSPTAQINPNSDPATVQQNSSNLFNGNSIVREQGGPVPFGFGRPFHGGTLISSGVFSEDTSA